MKRLHKLDYKWIALSNTTLGMLMATINASILLIALPDIFRGIHIDPLAPGNISKDGRIGYSEVQFSKQSFDLKRGDIVKLENSIRDTLKPAGVQAQFTGEAEQPPPEFGLSELLGYFAAFIVLMVVFRTFVATTVRPSAA